MNKKIPFVAHMVLAAIIWVAFTHITTEIAFGGDCDYYDKDGNLVEWDCKMRVHPDWQKKYGPCAFMVKMYKFVNPDYKKTGGAYVTVMITRVKAGPVDIDPLKGTINGVYHECLDQKERFEKLLEMARKQQEEERRLKEEAKAKRKTR